MDTTSIQLTIRHFAMVGSCVFTVEDVLEESVQEPGPWVQATPQRLEIGPSREKVGRAPEIGTEVLAKHRCPNE